MSAEMVELNFRGVAIGNGFVSPADTFIIYADMLYQMVSEPTVKDFSQSVKNLQTC